MTRGYQFTLANPATKYNLWNDLITKDPSFTDLTFSGRDAFGNSGNTAGFFVPNPVSSLRVRLPFNQTGNAGNNLSILDALTGEEKNNILTGELHEEVSIRNNLDLKQTQFQPSAGGMIVDVQITSI